MKEYITERHVQLFVLSCIRCRCLILSRPIQQSECKLGTVVRLLRCNLKVPGLNMEITFPQMGVRVFHLTISRLCNGLVPCILSCIVNCACYSLFCLMYVILRWRLSFFFLHGFIKNIFLA